MKNTSKRITIILFAAIIGFSMAACGDGSGYVGGLGDDNETETGNGSGGGSGGSGGGGGGGGGSLQTLMGTVTISPHENVKTGTELTAAYTGTEAVSYQWKRNGSNIGTNSSKFTPAQAGTYAVTVSASGYNSKSSNSVTVSIPDLAGAVTISGTRTTGQALTANYSGSESGTKSWQWEKDGSNIGTNSATFTPGASGTYTVTLTITGHNPKTSAPVDVSDPVNSNFTGTIAINGTPKTGSALTASYTGGSETGMEYEWLHNGNKVGTNSVTYTPTDGGSYTVTIKKTGYNNKTSAPVTVTQSVTGVTLNKSSTNLTIGGPTETLIATVLPENAGNTAISWVSSNTGVATVSASGVVTAVAAGTATITVTTADGGKTAQCVVTATQTHTVEWGIMHPQGYYPEYPDWDINQNNPDWILDHSVIKDTFNGLRQQGEIVQKDGYAMYATPKFLLSQSVDLNMSGTTVIRFVGDPSDLNAHLYLIVPTSLGNAVLENEGNMIVTQTWQRIDLGYNRTMWVQGDPVVGWGLGNTGFVFKISF